MPLRALTLSLLLIAASCSAEDTSDKLQIAVIPKATTHDFWRSVHLGVVTAARELGVHAIWKGPLREDDRDAQIKLLEEKFVSR